MTNEEKQLFESIIHTLDTAGHGVMNWRDIEDCRAKLKLASMCPATVTEQAPASEKCNHSFNQTAQTTTHLEQAPVGEKCSYSFNQTPLAHRTCTLPKGHEGPCSWGPWTENLW